MTVAPGEGERRAQRGLVPQYKVAAEKIYALLADGRLHAVGIADPEADTLDDIQLIRRQGTQLILDAYQVKWSAPAEVLADGAFEGLLAKLFRAREVVKAAVERRAVDGYGPVTRVIATSTRRGWPRPRPCSEPACAELVAHCMISSTAFGGLPSVRSSAPSATSTPCGNRTSRSLRRAAR